MPVSLAKKRGADRLIVVNLESVGLVQTNIKELSNDKNTVYICPRYDLGNFLIFEKDTAKRNIRLGYLDTLKAFSFFDGTLFTFAKHEFSRLAKSKHVTLKKQKEFFQNRRLKGNLLDLSAYTAMEKFLQGSTTRPLTFPVMLETAAETAGSILELSPLTLYTFDSFHETLKHRVLSVMEEKNINEVYENFQKKKLSLKGNFLKQLDQKAVTIFLALLFSKTPEAIFRVAGLFPKESVAAFYLATFDLIPS